MLLVSGVSRSPEKITELTVDRFAMICYKGRPMQGAAIYFFSSCRKILLTVQK
jgi:hypothetical protein